MSGGLAEIRRQAVDCCDVLAVALLGQANPKLSNRRELRWGASGKLVLALAGDRRGWWYDFSDGAGGDIIALVERETGGSFSQAIDWICRELNLASLSGDRPGDGRRRASGPSSRPSFIAARRPAPDVSFLAARIWRESIDPCGSIAETYLASRDLRLPPEVAGQVIRFHPACPWEGGQAPALIAAFVPIEAAACDDPFIDPPVMAIHRIRGRGHGNKRMLGATGGKAIMLSPWWHVAGTLHVCEGLETALALYGGSTESGDDADAWQFDGDAHRPVWALGAAGAFSTLPVIERVRRLVIWADHDRSGTSVVNARRCAQRWVDSGRDVVIRCPVEIETDYADRVERLFHG